MKGATTVDEEMERQSRFTGNERNTFRRTSIVISSATSSPMHGHKYNAFIRTCDKYPLLLFIFLILLMSTTTIIGCSIFFSYRNRTLDKRGSTLVLTSGEGLIAKINSYIIDLPESECHGKISSYPDGRYSQNLFDIITGESEDDFFQPRNCKWVAEFPSLISGGLTPYPINLVGKCNINAVTAAYTEGVAIVFKGNDLFKQSSLIGMCQADNFIRNFQNYENKCRSSEEGNTCCPSRSLPNYVAALSNLTSCEDITQDSIDYTQQLLSSCYSHYIDGSLTSDCWNWDNSTTKTTQCPYVPSNCTKYNAVYDMYTSLMESSYSPATNKLTVGKLLIPYNDTSKEWLLDLYYDRLQERTGDSFGGAELVAYNLRIKTEVFQQILHTDLYFLIPITFILFISILLATGMSLFLSFYSLLGIYFCFGMTWFIYGAVLWMEYAPFYIFFSLAISIYVGLLFLFSYLKSWNESFDVLGVEHPDIDRLAYVWHHTCLKHFAVSGSCSCCLFAIILFPLPSMKCFGLFSGLSMIFLFLVAIFYFPTLVLLNHKLHSPLSSNQITLFPCSCCSSCSSTSSKRSGLQKIILDSWSSLKQSLNTTLNKSTQLIDNFLYYLFKWQNITLFLIFIISLLIGSMALYIDIDDVATPQLLFSHHPFELYDRKYDLKFRSSALNTDNYFSMVVVFGVQNSNTVEPFNPSSKTSAQFNLLNISGETQQILLYNMCEYMIAQRGRRDFNISIQNIQCYPYFFQQWMSVPCEDTKDEPYPDTTTWLTPNRTSSSTCCGYDSNQISYPEEEFLSCTSLWSSSYGGFETGLWWNPENHQIIAVTIGMDSREKFSNDYTDGLKYWSDLDDWTTNYFKHTELRKSYSTSNMALLRYQRGLIVGFSIVSPLCICIGALVVYFMSRNIIAAFSVFLSTYMILWILGGSVELYGVRFSLFLSMSASFAMAVGCGISSFLSHSYCEAGYSGFANNNEIGSYLGNELSPILVSLTITSWFTALCLLGCQSYFSYGFGVIFVSIAFYCWVLPYMWNLLFLMVFWTKQPVGQLFVFFGLTPPPCCFVENNNGNGNGSGRSNSNNHHSPLYNNGSHSKSQIQVTTNVSNPLGGESHS